jgi:hypothetical protein
MENALTTKTNEAPYAVIPRPGSFGPRDLLLSSCETSETASPKAALVI